MELGEEKLKHWTEFAATVSRLSRRGVRGLRALSGTELNRLVDDYQVLVADLARARSLGAPRSVVDRLNRIAVAAYILLYGHLRRDREGTTKAAWLTAFARAVRQSLWAVALSATIMFGAAVVAFFAVQWQPALGFDMVPAEFLDFDPARPDNLHHIPSLARPVVSSAIVANNIQVTLLAFGLGLTAGLGTTWLLIVNGVHIGAVAGWFTLHGKTRAFWGWVMPHGGTELLAICLAGAAGYVLAAAIVSPGQVRRATALRQVGGRALVILTGCMVMLVVAGFIEGFVSPSTLPFAGRVVFLGVSLALWFLYFAVGFDPGKRSG
ncbi:MAG TPA: stage II sporulation protein M [Verrucomicrobiota bacterium]|nr:stage II sporulation protein M [Verrucomicrobiota bacterium]HNU52035.1 stage II sporulation protein M [Verrucomicrobiota bacterium]